MNNNQLMLIAISLVLIFGVIMGVFIKNNEKEPVYNIPPTQSEDLPPTNSDPIYLDKLTLEYPNNVTTGVQWTDLSDGEVAQFLCKIDGELVLDSSDINLELSVNGAVMDLVLTYSADNSTGVSYYDGSAIYRGDGSVHLANALNVNVTLFNGFDLNYETSKTTNANCISIIFYMSLDPSTELTISEIKVNSLVQNEIEYIQQ